MTAKDMIDVFKLGKDEGYSQGYQKGRAEVSLKVSAEIARLREQMKGMVPEKIVFEQERKIEELRNQIATLLGEPTFEERTQQLIDKYKAKENI